MNDLNSITFNREEKKNKRHSEIRSKSLAPHDFGNLFNDQESQSSFDETKVEDAINRNACAIYYSSWLAFKTELTTKMKN